MGAGHGHKNLTGIHFALAEDAVKPIRMVKAHGFKILLIVLPFHILLDRLAWRSRASLFICALVLILPQF